MIISILLATPMILLYFILSKIYKSVLVEAENYEIGSWKYKYYSFISNVYAAVSVATFMVGLLLMYFGGLVIYFLWQTTVLHN